MIKRMLILMGETPSSVVARDLGFRLAARAGAGVSGLAGVDLAYIEAPGPTPIGGAAYKTRMEDQLKRQADAARQRLHDVFERECTAHGLEFEWQSFSGDPNETLNLAVETRDIVVTGHDTAFHGKVREAFPEMLSNLLRATPRPVIVCPDAAPAEGEILVAYDGSVPAMRAVQLFAVLGVGAGRRVSVTSVDEDQGMAARRASGAVSYLRAHGVEAGAVPIASRAHAADIIAAQVADRGAGMVVMGAYGHRGWRERLFGSATERMVESPPCALFIYH